MKRRLPSVRTLRTICPDRAPELRRVLEADRAALLAMLAYPTSYRVTAQWVGACYHAPATADIRLAIADEILGTHGVESIPAGRNRRSPAIEYCNAGDPYIPTLLRVNGSYRVGDWGSITERGDYS